MTDRVLEELVRARRHRKPCALATVAATTGSVPREAGAKMLVYASDKICGTVGGGKFEALVIDDCLASIQTKTVMLKTYPLHEAAPDSFGAICGGEVTVLIEPQARTAAIFLFGGGHCSLAIARLAIDCGLHVTVVDERRELSENFPEDVEWVTDVSAPDFIGSRKWEADEAIMLVSRRSDLDRDALGAALKNPGAGYVGMIGSARKVRRVFEELQAGGIARERLDSVYAPIGLDIGADSPAEIAISVLAEFLKVMRQRGGAHLRDLGSRNSCSHGPVGRPPAQRASAENVP